MPQDSLLDTDPMYTGYNFELREVVTTQGRVWQITVKRQLDHDRWTTVWMASVSGVMLDFVQTYASDSVAAFMFGERRDLVHALATTHKLARAHARAHEF